MIEIENLSITYRTDQGTVPAVRGISLSVADGQFFTLLGPSGCGKTTTLRALAGLETPDAGTIRLGDTTVFSTDRKINVPPYRREIGMVFQSYAIWPHMDVFENIAFPLREKGEKLSRDAMRERVMKALNLVQLGHLAERPAPFLSGGQQQRLALARALALEPHVLLLDEPLSNLDAKLRDEMRGEIRSLVKRLGITTVYVTHDQLEALTMSDVVAVMDAGVISQQGSPEEIYERPDNRFVASFIGRTNLIPASVRAGATGNAGIGEVDTGKGALRCVLAAGLRPGDSVAVSMRPENIYVGDGANGRDVNRIRGRVAETSYLGDSLDCVVETDVGEINVRLHPSKRIRPDENVELTIPVDTCRAVRD